MMKLDKYQTNELLKRIGEDNYIYGVILKITYLYARSIGEVGELQRKDIDFDNDTINFQIFNNDREKVKYPICKDIYNDLQHITEDKQSEEYIFDEYIDHTKIRAWLNIYFYNKCPELTDLDFLKGVVLTTQDFRILRGQHLFLDGVDIKTINQLYQHKNMNSTKNLIKYDELKRKEITTDMILDEYTDLNLYRNWEYHNYVTFYCTYQKEEALIELDTGLKEVIFLEGSNIIIDKLNSYNHLVDDLLKLTHGGDYKIIKEVIVLRN